MYALFIIWHGNAGRLIQYTIHKDLDVPLDNVCTFQIQRNIGEKTHNYRQDVLIFTERYFIIQS